MGVGNRVYRQGHERQWVNWMSKGDVSLRPFVQRRAGPQMLNEGGERTGRLAMTAGRKAGAETENGKETFGQEISLSLARHSDQLFLLRRSVARQEGRNFPEPVR